MRGTISAILFLTLASVSPAQQTSSGARFDGNSWWAHVKFLADDSLEGRDTGSEGLRKAQAYAVEQLQKAGLEPAGTNGFYQTVRFNQFEVDEAKSSLALVADGKSTALSFADDAFIGTRATRASANISVPLVFIGYGLKIPEKNLDELAGLDLKGKIAVYLAGSPSDIPHRPGLALSNRRRALEIAACRRRHRHHYHFQSSVHGYSMVAHFRQSQSSVHGSCRSGIQ